MLEKLFLKNIQTLIVKEGKLWYFSSLPIGASAINNDLHDFLKVSKKDIDQLKKRYGSATADGVPDNTTVPVKMAGHTKKQILQRNIAEIAEERLKDIAGFVVRELKAAKFSTKLPCGIVLTGGSAYLSNIDQLFARELQMEVRFGRMLNGVDDESQQMISAFPQSVVVGLLLYGAKHNACETSPEIVLPISTNGVAPTPISETPIEPKADIFTNIPPVVVPPIEEVKAEEVNDVSGENEVSQPPVEVVAEPKEEQGEPKLEPKPEPKSEPKERRSGWMDRFRNWVDDMFTDEYI